MVQFILSTEGCSCLTHLFWGWTAKFGIAEFGIKTLETYLYRVVEAEVYFDILDHLGAKVKVNRWIDIGLYVHGEP